MSSIGFLILFFRFQVAGFSAFADVACEVTDKESFNNVKHWVQEGRSDQNLDLEDFWWWFNGDLTVSTTWF